MALVKNHERLRNAGDIAAAKLTDPSAVVPIYIRLPPPGKRCPYTGLSRSAMADLCVKSDRNPRPPIRSFRIPRHKDDKRAVRLVEFKSLMEYLAAFLHEAA
jgi:hypothetical protein